MTEHRQRRIGDPTQPIEVDAEDDHPDDQQPQQDVVRAGHRDWRRGERLIKEHRAHDARVVVERHRAVEHADDRQGDLPASAAIDERLEQVKLADEASQRRQSGETEKEDGEGYRSGAREESPWYSKIDSEPDSLPTAPTTRKAPRFMNR